jgi:hypothetical protein
LQSTVTAPTSYMASSFADASSGVISSPQSSPSPVSTISNSANHNNVH